MTTKHTGTVDEAAEVLQVSRNSAYEAVKAGEIPSMRVGGRILVLWGPLMRKLGVDPAPRDPAPRIAYLEAALELVATSESHNAAIHLARIALGLEEQRKWLHLKAASRCP